MKQANPNFKKGFKYQYNCQRCAPTYEALRRGYDVLAKPTTAKSKEELLKDEFTSYYKNGFAMMYKNVDIINANRKIKVSASTIKQSMTEWGDGARCEICIVRRDMTAHVFFAEQINGETIFLDPQINKVYNDNVFDDVLELYTKYFRVDNLEFSNRIIECCLNRKEKRK